MRTNCVDAASAGFKTHRDLFALLFALLMLLPKPIIFAQTPVASVQVIFESDVLLAQVSATPAVILLGAVGDTLVNRTVEWSSSNSAVAIVNGAGLVTAVGAGEAQISARVEGKTGSASVTVEPRSKFEGDCRWCIFDSNNPRHPAWDPVRQGNVPHPADQRQQIVIDENFSVPTGSEVIWENKIVWIRPQQRKNIDVFGMLKIRNSLLLWDQTQHQQARLDIQSGGLLHIVNSYAFSSNFFYVNWEYRNGSAVYFNHYQGNPWTTIHGAVTYTAINGSSVTMTLQSETQNTTVNVSDAHNVWFECFPAPGTYQFTFPEKGKWTDWQPPAFWPNTSVRFFNSYIYDRDITLNNGVHATVTNTPSGFGVGWTISKLTPGFVEGELRNLGEPNNDAGVLFQNKTWSIPGISSLTVINSRVQRAWPSIFGNVHLKVIESNLADPRVWGPATYQIYNSSVENAAAYGGGDGSGGRMYIENTKIRYDIQVSGNGSFVYGYGLSPSGSTMFSVYEENSGKYVALTTPGSATNLLPASGNNQSSPLSQILPKPFVVKVTNILGLAAKGIPVTFNLTSVPSGATGHSLSTTSTQTDASGEASTVLTVGNMPGAYLVTAASSGLSGSPTIFTANATGTTGVDILNSSPVEFLLHPIFPNPFNPSSTVRFSVRENQRALVRAFDILGKEVNVLFDGEAVAGQRYQLSFDAAALPSGMYMIRLESGGQIATQKVMLVR